MEEKESSEPRKHLDNCLLQHEKQLEVSGSRGWRGGRVRGEAAGAAGQRFALSVRRDRERGELGNSAGVGRRDPLISRGS